MNKSVKSTIKKYADRLGSMQDELHAIKEDIVEACSNEQEKYDNLSEAAQEGDNGQLISSIIDNLESASESLEGVDDEIGNARDYLMSIVE